MAVPPGAARLAGTWAGGWEHIDTAPVSPRVTPSALAGQRALTVRSLISYMDTRLPSRPDIPGYSQPVRSVPSPRAPAHFGVGGLHCSRGSAHSRNLGLAQKRPRLTREGHTGSETP